MAVGKGKILKEQITFDFFEEIKVEKTNQNKGKVLKTKPIKKDKVKKVKFIRFRKDKTNVKSNHIKINRKARRIIRR